MNFALWRIGANENIRRVPSIARIDVVGARRSDANQIGKRAQQDVIAGPRPGFIRNDLIMQIHAGVVEKIQRFPALALGDSVRIQGVIEIVGAVDVSGISHIVILPGIACRRESVMAAARVLDHLDERLEVEGKGLRRQARHRQGAMRERSRDGGIERMFDALFELLGRETLEVRHLPSVDVQNLDVLAGSDGKRLRRGSAYAHLLQRVPQRVGERIAARLVVDKCRSPDKKLQIGGRVLAFEVHHAAGSCDAQDRIPLDGELGFLAGKPGSEDPQGGLVARHTQNARVGPAIRGSGGQFGNLQTFFVDYSDVIAGIDRHGQRTAALHGVAFESEGQRADAGPQNTTGAGWKQSIHIAITFQGYGLSLRPRPPGSGWP